MNDFQFNYDDIEPLNYNGQKGLSEDLDEIIKNTINVTIDWKKREGALKKLGQICMGDQGDSDTFIRSFNNQLCNYLGIQIADLRSSVMKEACRITSLCAKKLGILIEQGALYLLTQYVLFKIAGSANRVISDSSARCILNLVKYVNTIKVITNVCDQKTMKSNFVRNICAQCILYIMTCYNKNLISKTNNILQDTMKSLLSDANGEVRATSRRAFITYRKRFEIEGEEFFEILEKNVQKQINEDERKYGDDIIVDPETGGEMNFENGKKSTLYNTSNKARSQEVKYNLKGNINIDKANATFQKEFKSQEIEDKFNDVNDVDTNLYSRQFSDTTKYSDDNKNEKIDTNNNNNATKSFKAQANKSFKTKENKNSSVNSKTQKLNNKELLKKLNDKFYNNNNNSTNMNSDNNTNTNTVINNYTKVSSEEYSNSEYVKKEKNKESQKYVKPFNSTLNKKPKIKKSVNNTNQKNNNNNYNNNDNNTINSNAQKNQNNKNQNNNSVSTNNYIQSNNNNINDNFNININKDSMEYKLIERINQLNMYNNNKEKLKIFLYMFNSFNDILQDVNNISDITLRQFVDIHIEYIIYEDKPLTEQIIKNLMRMIFYMTQIFNSNDIKLIVKLLMMKINMGEKTVSKLSYELLDLIRKKWKIEDIYDGIFNLLEEKKTGYNDVCYEYLTLLVIYYGDIFEDINYFRRIFKIIFDGGMNSKKIGKLIEALYKKNSTNFIQTLKEQSPDNQKKLLVFLDNKNSNNNNSNSNSNNNNNNSYPQQQNQNSNNCGKIKRIVNKSNMSANSGSMEEMKSYIENGNVKSFLDYLENNRNYLPNFFMLLSDEKYSEFKYSKNLLNFIYSLISLPNNLSNEISQNMEILIEQLIHFFLMNINNSLIIDLVKEILNILPNKTNSEKYYKSISKYLNAKNNAILLQALLMCIKNNVMNDKSKNLEKQLPYFIEGVLNLLNHQSSDVRKYAVYCCVEIYMVLGHKFDVYLELLPKSQQNLINLFIKKKNS